MNIKNFAMASVLGLAAAVTVNAEAEGVSSANIVGYSTQSMLAETGYNFIIPTFVDVGADTATYDLQNLKLVNAPGDGMTDYIVGYDQDACLTMEDYYWTTVAGDFMQICQKDGWYNGMMGTELVESKTLSLGTGLYLYLGTAGASVQYAGQVFAEAFTTPALSAGYSMVGNATPVVQDLQNIKLVDAPGDGMTDYIVGYDANACLTEEDYYWTTVEGDFMQICQKDGWYNGMMGTELVEDYTLQPGQGFYLYLGTEGAKVKFPACITNAN